MLKYNAGENWPPGGSSGMPNHGASLPLGGGPGHNAGSMGIGMYPPAYSPAIMNFLENNEMGMANQAIIGQRKIIGKKKIKGEKNEDISQ